MERWQYVTDTHGDLICPVARDAVLKFRDKFKPTVRIHGGDMFDFRALRGGASDEERAEGIAADLDAGLKFLRDYSPTHLLLGNHDFRLIEKAERCANGMLQEHCRLLVGKIEEACADIGCKLYPYDVERGVLKYGNYKFVHGYVHNMHSAHKAAACFGNVIMGHVHGFQRASPERDDNPTGWTCGHLADASRMGYARRRQGFLRWRQGFMYGWRTNADRLLINTVEKEGDEWVYPTKFNR
jgi:hypothetical protein